MNIDKIKQAAEIIQKGGVVAFPTETVYGLGANALNPIAVAKIFQLKERPSFDPLIVHIANFDMLNILTDKLSSNTEMLVRIFWPGPLTIVVPKKEIVPDIVTSGLPTVGIRMPDHPVALSLIAEANCPIAAPSANKFGKLSPTEAIHVSKQIPEVDYILDGGKTKVGIESTIVMVSENTCRILRPGKITAEDIRQAMPHLNVLVQSKNEEILAPGLLNSHYSPKKPLYILSDINTKIPENTGLILHTNTFENSSAAKTIFLSKNNDLLEIASNLFTAMHKMEDDNSVNQIYIEPVKEEGIGIAIMDRIKKAAYQYLSK